jgi:ferric-dicitrate binding protein FerR (iron transport regulator)
MNFEIPYDLIAKFLSGECSDEETRKLEEWKKASNNNREIFDQMKFAMHNLTPESYEPNIDDALAKVSARLGKQKPKLINFNRYWIAAAAALVIGFGIFSVVKVSSSKSSLQTIDTYSQTTPQEILLPDGSSVFLSKNSKLAYPKKFKGDERKVEFEGEAYFTITPDKSKPFIIESERTITKVLGTEFNLKAVKSDSIFRVTVTKGLVSFNLLENQSASEVNVGAGEVGEADLAKMNVQKFKNTDPNFLAWKTGILSFENQKLGSAVKFISDYYNKQFRLAPELDSVVFSYTIDNLTIDQAIEGMQLLLIDVDIAMENGVYVLRRKS